MRVACQPSGVANSPDAHGAIGPWTCFHFSQANPVGPEQGDLPRLLRTVADSIAALGDVRVLDLALTMEITAEGPRPAMTVCYTESQ